MIPSKIFEGLKLAKGMDGEIKTIGRALKVEPEY
jgi:hypothetical protein